jgi:hypothetical protein
LSYRPPGATDQQSLEEIENRVISVSAKVVPAFRVPTAGRDVRHPQLPLTARKEVFDLGLPAGITVRAAPNRGFWAGLLRSVLDCRRWNGCPG